MSILKMIRSQLGLSATAANNFTLDASADNGTMKLARGNAGATTQDVLTVSAGGEVALPANTTTKLVAASGSAPVYGCRAWVQWDCSRNSGGGTDAANTNRFIRSSGNVTSVLKNASGDYTITFTTAMPSADYAMAGAASAISWWGGVHLNSGTAPTTTTVRVAITNDANAGTYSDPVYASIAIFC